MKRKRSLNLFLVFVVIILSSFLVLAAGEDCCEDDDCGVNEECLAYESGSACGQTGYGMCVKSTSDKNNLTIWDDNDVYDGGNVLRGAGEKVYVDEQVYFYAEYINATSGNKISGAVCNVTYYRPDGVMLQKESMSEDAWYYEEDRENGFTPGGTYSWDVFCNASNYDLLGASDTLIVSPFSNIDEPGWSQNLSVYDSGGLVNFSTIEKTLWIANNSKKIVEFYINASFNLSEVDVNFSEALGKSFVTNLSNSSGINYSEGHVLYVPKINNYGVYICPQAVSFSTVYEGCPSEYSYSEVECDEGAGNCSIVSQGGVDYYRVESVVGSGGGNPEQEGDGNGEGDGIIPEFSAIGLVLSLVVIFTGIY